MFGYQDFGVDSGKYRFCNTDNNPIVFGPQKITIGETTYDNAYDYMVQEGTIEVDNFLDNETGVWVKVNNELNPIDESGIIITDEENILNILKTEEFTWEDNIS